MSLSDKISQSYSSALNKPLSSKTLAAISSLLTKSVQQADMSHINTAVLLGLNAILTMACHLPKVCLGVHVVITIQVP